jgi:hypothetical protein
MADDNYLDSDMVLTRETPKRLLEDPGLTSLLDSEEKRRPWAKHWNWIIRDANDGILTGLYNNSILMRCYDRVSGGPDEYGRMQARGARMLLDTHERRRDTLTMHADYMTRDDTPYISFTDSPQALQELADKRQDEGRRGDRQDIVVVVHESESNSACPS